MNYDTLEGLGRMDDTFKEHVHTDWCPYLNGIDIMTEAG